MCKNLAKKHATKIKLQNATFIALPKMVMSERIIVMCTPHLIISMKAETITVTINASIVVVGFNHMLRS